MGRLDGKIALVTGTASGIARATAILFAKEGASVATCDVNEAGGRATVETILQDGGMTFFKRADVSKRAEVEALIEETVKQYGGIDALVNAAAVGAFGMTVESISEEEWDRVLAINLKSVFLVSKYAIPHMRRRGGGSIINIASVHSFATSPEVAPYAAAKGGVLALSRQMALDFVGDKIRVNAVCPGAVDTPMMHEHVRRSGLTAEQIGFTFDQTKIARVARPEELAKAILFLATDDSSFMTGAPLIVDGGLLAKL